MNDDKKPTTGRPRGSKNVTETVDVEPSRCPGCGSTDRSEYTGRTVQEFGGVYNGRPYTAIIRRRCQCNNCGQHRIDRSFEFVPEFKDTVVPEK